MKTVVENWMLKAVGIVFDDSRNRSKSQILENQNRVIEIMNLIRVLFYGEKDNACVKRAFNFMCKFDSSNSAVEEIKNILEEKLK